MTTPTAPAAQTAAPVVRPFRLMLKNSSRKVAGTYSTLERARLARAKLIDLGYDPTSLYVTRLTRGQWKPVDL